jgi:protein O-mannosyl-transferase
MNKQGNSWQALYQRLLSNSALLLLLFVGLTLTLYGNALHNEFTFDDLNNIQHNQYLRSFKGIVSLAFSPVQQSEVLRGYLYRPLAALIEYFIGTVFGFTPIPFHTASILLYALNCFILFKVFKKLFSCDTAFIASLIFLFHPLHTEIVASAVSITELLAFLFGMLAVLFYLKASNGTYYVVFSSLCYAAALLSKETAVIVPLVIFLIALFQNGSMQKYARITVWYGIPLCVYFALRYHVLGSFLQAKGNLIPFLSNPLLGMSFGQRLVNAQYLLGNYFKLLVMPVRLSADYSYNSIPLLTSVLSVSAIIALVTHLVLLSIAFIYRNNNKLITFSIVIFYIGMIPSCNIFFLSGTIMGERLVYLSSTGIATGILLFQQAVITRASIMLITSFSRPLFHPLPESRLPLSYYNYLYLFSILRYI